MQISTPAPVPDQGEVPEPAGYANAKVMATEPGRSLFPVAEPFAAALKCYGHLFIYKLELKPGMAGCKNSSCAFAIFNSWVGGSAENKHWHWLVPLTERAALCCELWTQTCFSPCRPSWWRKKGDGLPSTNIQLFYSIGKPVRDLHCYWFWYLNNQHQSSVFLVPSWFLGSFFRCFSFSRGFAFPGSLVEWVCLTRINSVPCFITIYDWS